jgi:hypothetical protein
MVADAPTLDREAFLARLTTTAYQVALRHGIRGSFAELELDLWHELRAVCEAEEPTEGAREWPR